MSYTECMPLVKQLNHSEKLKLAQWLIQVIAQEEGVYANETDFVLKNSVLMSQIELSTQTHQNRQGYKPTTEELNEILSF
ncbi:MAG: hypothetical protein NTZ70_03835 [Methylococcales bacterium]|nr:hypothetical protein [Methylococcales bacterium]